MSILGYSSAYFLPQYWAGTPLYGEKIIPLLDYVLSTDYAHTDKLASAFYDIESKYKNTADLPIDKIEAIIEESGYGYIRDLLGQDEDSLKLLVYTLVLVHQLKGSKRGIETVLEMLRASDSEMSLFITGSPKISSYKEVSGFSINDYLSFSNFTVANNIFDLTFKITTPANFNSEQCISSCANCGFYLGISTAGKLVLRVGQQSNGSRTWQTINDNSTFISDSKLSPNTTYYIKLSFTGTEYIVKVSTDNVKFYNYIAIDSTVPLNITGGVLYLGIDRSTGSTQYPFNGVMFLSPFSVSSKNVTITQWFETFPTGEENTFIVEADVNVDLMNANFFINFAKFIERYVYPTLKAFKARMNLTNKITFLPYVRQKVTYVATNLGKDGYENFTVIKRYSAQDRELFGVQVPDLYAWSWSTFTVYTKDEEIKATTKLYNSNKTLYTGTDFKVVQAADTYKITYKGADTSRDSDKDTYTPVSLQTISDDD